MLKDSLTFWLGTKDLVRNVCGRVPQDLVRDLKLNNRVFSARGVNVGRLEGFFKVLPKSSEELAKQKRKADDAAASKKAAKKGKTGGAPGRKGGK